MDGTLIGDKDGYLFNNAGMVANMKDNHLQITHKYIVNNPTPEQLRIAYVNSIESIVKSVDSNKLLKLEFIFPDTSVLIFKIDL